ncbi:MAG: acylphosphatase, partial [Candidatus Marinimicrobia bacterium]|nr:acylphosphatase [Candidatus Neomarinimicrobiota bacterium]
MSDIRLRLSIQGVVQGVGFRWFTKHTADHFNLAGWVRNEQNGTVTAEVEGDGGLVKEFLSELKTGNRYARVTRID